ncbi:PBS lyase HEAT domain protein repeat-containing protein [Methanofollis liminatans DSM 4140]|uniref:PBS lyase HEAT domain protein repeat-containing protein n=1 Tax=Methanofollis liminatans DSM 4140 TaxID=28892 RepID=J1L2L6_9EURY|nr:HEAT repeat domain-containing protein [Methanofollis liminatans]EJG07307.1 PBS lyase HEAT domain protein repeat-containing protein [Methanofollis liminatans DSM 4140]
MGTSGEEADRRAAEQEMMIAEFLKNLTHERPEYRWGAADALGRIGDERAVEPLIAAMKDPDPRVRKKAAWALGQIGDSRGQRPLLEAIRDEDDDVREIAAEAYEILKKKVFGGG